MKDVTLQLQDAQVLLLPDPADRTENDPIYLMSSGDVLKLVNKFIEKANYHALAGNGFSEISAKRQITKEHINEILLAAKVAGWSEVISIGKQLMFVKNGLVQDDTITTATSLRAKAQPIEVQSD